MGLSHTNPKKVAEHVDRIHAAVAEFNAAIQAAEDDHIGVKYNKTETAKGGWNGPIVIKEITHIVWLRPAAEKDQDQP